MINNHGSSFDDFLNEEGIFDEVEREAIKRVIEWLAKQTNRDADIE